MKNLIGKLFMDLDKIATPTARNIFLSKNHWDQEKEFAFFSSLKLNNGVTKTTDRNRMSDVDSWLCEFLKPGQLHRVLDVGISSGITTVELSQTFEAKNIVYELTGMDSDLTAYLLIFNNKESVLIDKNANLIHFEIGGKGFGYVKGTNPRHFIDREILRAKAKFFIRRHLKGGFTSVRTVFKNHGAEIHQIKLVCSEIRENQKIRLLEESVFSNVSGSRFDVIRAANILNHSYFNADQLKDAVTKLGNRLEKNGLFLVCRTSMGGQNNATLFRLAAKNTFEIVGRFGNGSEIEELIRNLNDSLILKADC